MNTDFKDIKHKKLTDKIIKVFCQVYNKLGYGFLGKVYLNTMMVEFNKEGLVAVSEHAINVLYEPEIIGKYFADIFVDNKVIVKTKA